MFAYEKHSIELFKLLNDVLFFQDDADAAIDMVSFAYFHKVKTTSIRNENVLNLVFVSDAN